MTEKERVEKLKREAIEIYYMKNPATTPGANSKKEADSKKQRRSTLKKHSII